MGSSVSSLLCPAPDRGAWGCALGSLGSIQLPVINASLDEVMLRTRKEGVVSPQPRGLIQKPQMQAVQGVVLIGTWV